MIWRAIFLVAFVAGASLQLSVQRSPPQNPYENVFVEDCPILTDDIQSLKIIYAGPRFKMCMSKLLHEDDRVYNNITSVRQLLAQMACHKVRKFMECVYPLLHVLEKCMTEEARVGVEHFSRVLNQTIDFVCEDEGKLIRLFLESKGMKCVKKAKRNIKQCNSRIPAIPKGSIFLKRSICHLLNSGVSCAVNEMEKCEYTEPVTILKSGTHFLTDYCKNEIPYEQTKHEDDSYDDLDEDYEELDHEDEMSTELSTGTQAPHGVTESFTQQVANAERTTVMAPAQDGAAATTEYLTKKHDEMKENESLTQYSTMIMEAAKELVPTTTEINLDSDNFL